DPQGRAARARAARLRRLDHRHPPRAGADTRERAARGMERALRRLEGTAPRHWDAKRVQAYIYVNEIPYNPLHDAGYPSIGCVPCTKPVAAGAGERAGRWVESE